MKSALVSMYAFFRPGKPVSRKVVASALTSFFVYLAALAGARLGLHLTEAQSALASAACSSLAGFVAGWLRKEFPTVIVDGDDAAMSSLSAPAAPPIPADGSEHPDAPASLSEPNAANVAADQAEAMRAISEAVKSAAAEPAPKPAAEPEPDPKPEPKETPHDDEITAIMPVVRARRILPGQPPPAS